MYGKGMKRASVNYVSNDTGLKRNIY